MAGVASQVLLYFFLIIRYIHSKQVGIGFDLHSEKREKMRVSTKGRYALQLMFDLAVYNSGEPISLKDIARRQGISEKYLEQIIAVLNKSGYVKSVRGAQGGYMLKMKPEEYTVGMILRLTEGDLAPVECVVDGNECDRQVGCVMSVVWKKMYAAINEVIDSITLADMLEMQSKAGDR